MLTNLDTFTLCNIVSVDFLVKSDFHFLQTRMAAISDGTICCICADPLEWTAYGVCNHKETCSKCVARWRFVLKVRGSSHECMFLMHFCLCVPPRLRHHSLHHLPKPLVQDNTCMVCKTELPGVYMTRCK